MDFALNEEQQGFVATARAFAQDQLAPYAAEWDANSHFAKDALRQAGELGFMGMYTPEHAGGLAMPRLDASLIVEELAKGCTTTAAFLTIHNMATNMIGRYCQPDVIDQWCPDLVSGTKLASYCLTEPGAGSDAAALRTSAVTDGDHYVINGSKAFISGAGETDVLVLMLRTGDAGPKGVTAILVPADADGISYGKNEHKMGWNAQPTRAITFDDVRVPKKTGSAKKAKGSPSPWTAWMAAESTSPPAALAQRRRLLEDATAYVQERKQFGQSVADFQATQFTLSDMLTELVAARQMIRLAANKLDSGDGQAGTYCAMAKRFATDAGFNVCNNALQLLGGYGYLKEYPMERYVRDTRVHQILEGTNQIMRVIISRRMLMAGALEVIQ